MVDDDLFVRHIHVNHLPKSFHKFLPKLDLMVLELLNFYTNMILLLL